MANELNEVAYQMPSGELVYVPSATSVATTLCDSCDALHVFLLDQVDQPIAEMALGEATLVGMLAKVRRRE